MITPRIPNNHPFGWPKPMDTAPKDGRLILIREKPRWDCEAGALVVAKWCNASDGEGSVWAWHRQFSQTDRWDQYSPINDPSGWWPLPTSW